MFLRRLRRTPDSAASASRIGRLAAVASVCLVFFILTPGPLRAECRVEGVGSELDFELARAACDRVSDRFGLLFGVDAPAGSVELSDTVLFFSIAENAPRWRLVWPTSARMAEFFGERLAPGESVEEMIATQWSAVLPHELGHLLLIAEADARRPPEIPRRRLPDWLHEGVGVWMEPPTIRETEYAMIRALRPFIASVQELVTFQAPRPADRGEGGSMVIQTFYPCASEEACGGRPHWERIFSVTTRQFADGRVQVDTTFHERAPPSPSPVGANFYAYSAALVRYLFDRGGSTAARELLARLVGTPVPSTELAGLLGLPSTPREVEADWRRWVGRWILEE